MVNLGTGDLSGFNVEQFVGGNVAVDVANMNLGVQVDKIGEDANATSLDAKIDGLFDLGPGGMDNLDLDYDLGGDHGDNSNFNDMYFGTGDGGTAAGEFDDAYFQ
jgi:hypothetical protein